jgi:hypothetical protein
MVKETLKWDIPVYLSWQFHSLVFKLIAGKVICGKAHGRTICHALFFDLV